MRDVIGFAIVNPHGDILLQLREDKPELPYPGHWVVPGGGIEEGETPVGTAQREMREELHLSVAKSELVPLGTYQRASDKVNASILVYHLQEDGALTSSEGQRVAFFSLPAVCAMTLGFEQHTYLVPLLKKHLRPVS